MQGKKMTIKRIIKKLPLELKSLFVILFIYFCLHFTYVKCDDTIIIGISYPLAPSDLFSDNLEGILLGGGELKTQFGTITVNPFCSFSSHNNNFRYIEGHNFKTGRAAHDFSILGNEIENPWVSFNFTGVGLSISQTLNIKGYDFGAGHISRVYNEKTNSSDLVFHIETNPVQIALSDGTHIEFLKAEQEAWLSVQDNNMWKLQVRDYEYFGENYFSVTPEGGEPEKYLEITFEENWGAFKDGKKYIAVKRRTYP